MTACCEAPAAVAGRGGHGVLPAARGNGPWARIAWSTIASDQAASVSSAGNCGQQHPVTGVQPAAAAQRGRDHDAGPGRHGDHAARIPAGDHHARLGGQGQPVTAPPAQRLVHGAVGDPA